MKVALSVQNENKQSMVDERFGRCPYFAIAETEQVNYLCYQRGANDNGAGVKAARILLKQKVEAVIVGNIGPRRLKC